jgi:hypothetical protein
MNEIVHRNFLKIFKPFASGFSEEKPRGSNPNKNLNERTQHQRHAK